MNFLLHLRLNEIAGLPAAGAIIGDVLRGRIDPALPAPLARSIALHRRIDALSDRHPQLLALKCRFTPAARRYAGIVLDLVCDYIAAKDWHRYGGGDETLDAFSRRMADQVAEPDLWHVSVGQPAPSTARFAALLVGYREASGIDHAIDHIAKRLSEPAPFLDAARAWPSQVEAAASALPTVFSDLADAARGFANPG
jgi:acyl carrier protein phosphodiesterase